MSDAAAPVSVSGPAPGDSPGPLLRVEAALTRALEAAVIAAMALLVLDVLWGVASRYALGNQARWSEELATALLVWVSLLASALVFRSHGHLGIDFLVEKMDPRARWVADRFGAAVTVLFAGSVMVFGGGTLVVQALRNGQTLPALGVSMAWVHAALPVSGLFIALYGLTRPAAAAATPPGDKPATPPEEEEPTDGDR